MFDKFLLKRSYKTDIFDKNFDTKYSILNNKILNPKGDNLVVVFPPKGNGEWVHRFLIKRLVAKNYAVLALYFDNNILSPDEKIIKSSFIFIRDDIVEMLKIINNSKKYNNIQFLGLSLGTVNLCMVANEFRGFSRAFLVCPGGRLSFSIWHGLRTIYIRRELERKNIDLEELAKFWKDLEPINNVRCFRDKEITIIYSDKDMVVPTVDQKIFIDNVAKSNSNITIKRSSAGHYFTIIKFCLFGRLNDL